jgi:putative oxidoreductase
MIGYMEKIIGEDPLSQENRLIPYLYSFSRIIIALLFLSHGMQKMIGAFGGVDGLGGTAKLLTLFGAAGVIEVFVGVAVALGVFTRLFALLAVIEMLVAYFMVHLPNGVFPITNGGELAIMYALFFSLITLFGSQRFSLEKMLSGREKF